MPQPASRSARFSVVIGGLGAIVVMGGVLIRGLQPIGVTNVSADVVSPSHQVSVTGMVTGVTDNVVTVSDGADNWTFLLSGATTIRQLTTSGTMVVAATGNAADVVSGARVSVTYSTIVPARPLPALTLDVLAP